jgi:phospholipase/lecithinase/hemolysin
MDPFGILSSVQGQEFLTGTGSSTTALYYLSLARQYLPNFITQPFINGLNDFVQYVAKDVSAMHNAHTKNLVTELNSGQTVINGDSKKLVTMMLDVEKFADAIAAEPLKFGILETKKFCDQDTSTLPLPNLGLNAEAGQTDCEGYLFYDPIHPTHYAHALLATYACRALDVFEDKYNVFGSSATATNTCATYLNEFDSYFTANSISKDDVLSNVMTLAEFSITDNAALYQELECTITGASSCPAMVIM